VRPGGQSGRRKKREIRCFSRQDVTQAPQRLRISACSCRRGLQHPTSRAACRHLRTDSARPIRKRTQVRYNPQQFTAFSAQWSFNVKLEIAHSRSHRPLQRSELEKQPLRLFTYLQFQIEVCFVFLATVGSSRLVMNVHPHFKSEHFSSCDREL